MIVQIIARHLAELVDELARERFNPAYEAFIEAGRSLAVEARDALDKYFVSADEVGLHKALILAAMDFTDSWERWLAGIRYPAFEYPETKVFHEYLLRFTKGAIKYWRIWRSDLSR